MNAAPALLLSSIAVFVLMFVLNNPSEGASIMLFPVGVVLALASLGTAVTGVVRRRGAAQAGSTAVVVVSLIVLFFAAVALLLFLWAVMGVFGNAWG